MLGFLPWRATRQRLAGIAVAVLGLCGIWRAGLAVRHYRLSLAITNDPSARELEQVSALLEFGVSVILLAHAVAAGWLRPPPAQSLPNRDPGPRPQSRECWWPGSFLQTPVLSLPGLLPALLIVGCAGAGFLSEAPWASVYLGALAGGIVGFCLTAPSLDPISALAVTAPLIVFALVGVAIGKGIRRLPPFQSAS